LASPHDAEVVGAARAIGRLLDAEGLSSNDLALRLEPRPEPDRRASWSPRTWDELIAFIMVEDFGRLTEREREFVRSMRSRVVLRGEPSEKQAAWLRSIYAKLGGNDL
jgi:hypothetical protein